MERIESLKAKERMSDGGKGRQKSDNLRTDDSVAEKLGFGSRDTYCKEKYIVENQESLSTDALNFLMNTMNLDMAEVEIQVEK